MQFYRYLLYKCIICDMAAKHRQRNLIFDTDKRLKRVHRARITGPDWSIGMIREWEKELMMLSIRNPEWYSS